MITQSLLMSIGGQSLAILVHIDECWDAAGSHRLSVIEEGPGSGPVAQAMTVQRFRPPELWNFGRRVITSLTNQLGPRDLL